MKKDQYIPHEVSIRNNTQVLNLIEAEGCAGYGIYWSLLEYLRVQENYIGDLQALSSLKRQLKIRQSKLDKVLHGYDLFVCVGNTFYSPKLNEVMKPFEDRRARIDAYKRNKENVKSLEINDKAISNSDIVSFEVKGKGEGKVKGKEDTSSPISSSSPVPGEEVKAEAAGVETPEETKPVSSVPVWERYIDELQQEEQWKELMAMRTGLKQQFYSLYPRIVDSFKRHVRLLGNEGHILSSSEAKRYFCFYLDPGSVTFKRLWDELQKSAVKGKFRYEDFNPTTGQRSYCGVPIPVDAPPRPNDQAAWNNETGKWVY